MLVDKKRIEMEIDVLDWVSQALDEPGMQLCHVIPRIAIKVLGCRESSTEIP